MLAHKALRAVLFTFILLSGSGFSIFLTPITQAQDTKGRTTLYFTNALNLESESEFISLTQKHPTSPTDSEFPPSILAKNRGPGKNTTLLSQEWLTWIMLAGVGELLDNMTGDEGLGDFGGFEYLFSSLNRITESYLYSGNDTLHIKGDVIYHLYFSDTRKIKSLTDSVNVSLYTLNMESLESILDFFPKRIKNTSVLLTPPAFLGGIYSQDIILSDVNFTLTPGEFIFVNIEINPKEKPMPLLNLLEKPLIKQMIEKIVNRWTSGAVRGPIRLKLGSLINNITAVLNETEVNFTSDDIAMFINVMKSTNFIYDSQGHPSSITIPAQISDNDIRTYYFVADQKLSITQQNGSTSSKTKILTTPTKWTTDNGLERNKILKIQNVTAELYFQRFLCLIPRKISVTVTLYEDENIIATSEKQLTKDELQGFLRKAVTPIIFNFTGEDQEITYGHSLSIGISLSNGTKKVITPLYLQPPSAIYPSQLRVEFEETKNIQVKNLTTTPPDGIIIPGGSIKYLLNVTSVLQDTLQIRTIEREKAGSWDTSFPSSIPVSANSRVSIPIYINSTSDQKEAYGSYLNLIVVITGNTGIAREPIFAEISQDAIEYKVEILGYPSTINISRGGEHIFYFVVKNNNTGAVDDVDNYTVSATSKNYWPLKPQEKIRNLGIGETTSASDVKILIKVPKNSTEDSDIITITVTSEGNPEASATINVTVKVIGEGFFEEIKEFLDSVAKSLGLNDLFGPDSGAIVLLTLLVVIILFFLIILAFVLTSKPVHIICTDRIKEIDPTQEAVFDITLKNPYKHSQTYEIGAQQTMPSSKWEIRVEPVTMTLYGRSSNHIKVIVTPTDAAEPKEWTQVTVSVKKTGKKRTQSIDLMTMMKEGTTLLQLQNVSHWPTTFNPGEKVITSFKLSNEGTISARNVKIFFYINGKQKNKVDVTLPAGNIADIQIPWIAEKGKNQIRIRVKE